MGVVVSLGLMRGSDGTGWEEIERLRTRASFPGAGVTVATQWIGDIVYRFCIVGTIGCRYPGGYCELIDDSDQ